MNLLLILTLAGVTAANKFISLGEFEHLLSKYVRNELTKSENETLNDAFEMLRFQSVSEKALENVSKPRLNLLCFGCRAVVSVFAGAIKLGIPDYFLTFGLTLICSALTDFQMFEVCKGLTKLNWPILKYVVENTPEFDPETFCGLLLQIAEEPLDGCTYNDSRFEWQVDLPPRSTAKKHQISGYEGTPLKVAVISDSHLDPLYKPGSPANCVDPTCCRQTSRTPFLFSHIDESVYEKSFAKYQEGFMLDLSIAEKIRKMRRPCVVKSSTAGYWGDYGKCDTPLWAFDDAIDRIAEAHKNVDVVYYFGDTIDHHSWETTYELNNVSNSYVVDKIRRSFGDKVKLVPVIGNHESQPINQFAPAYVSGEGLNTTWLYKSLAEKWKFYLPEDTWDKFLKQGEYSVLIRPGLRAISLNNIVAYRFNWWVIYDPRNAKKHLDWLVNELYQAELAGEKVHILTHIPPGDVDLIYIWTREYNRIVNRFASTIAAEFNGHMHSDEFRIFFNPAGEAISVAWNGGGLTTYTNFNPNYKIVQFHPGTYEPTQIDTYIYNLTEANLSPKVRPHWYKLYEFKQNYGLSDLSPASMSNLVTQMATRHTELLDLYSDYYYKMSDARPWCSHDCKSERLCNTVVTVLWERQKCEKFKKLYYSSMNH